MSGRVLPFRRPPHVATDDTCAEVLPTDVLSSEAAPPAPIKERDSGFAITFRSTEQEVDFVWRRLRRRDDDHWRTRRGGPRRRPPPFSEFETGHARARVFPDRAALAQDARRHRRRHPEDMDGGMALSRQSVEAEQTGAIVRREELDRLDRALASIDIDRRAVLVLYEIEEQTAPEIARTLGLSVNTVYSRLRVARAELEMALKREHLRRGGGVTG